MDAKRLGAYARLLAIIGSRMMNGYQTDLLWDISRLSFMDDGVPFKILLRSTASQFVDRDDEENGDIDSLRGLFDWCFSFDGDRRVEVSRLRENDEIDYEFTKRRMEKHLEDLKFDDFYLVWVE